MLIKDVCLKAKVTKKAVEYYIEQGLISPRILENGYYGIYDASQGYFDKWPIMLNDYECTMLAGIPQAPSVYSLDENPDLAEQRRQQVIACMINEEYIEAGEIM